MLHPLTKLIIVICISSISLIYNNIYVLGCLLVICLLMLSGKRNLDYFRLWKLFRYFLPLLLSVFLIQTIFNRQGQVLLKFSFISITDLGLKMALLVTLRLLVLFLSGVWLWGLSHRDFNQAFRIVGLPEALAVMISLTLRFLPLFLEKVKHNTTQIAMRGINLRSMQLRQKLNLYLKLVIPVLGWTLKDLKYLAIAMDLRGFRNGLKHTVYKRLKLKLWDYLLILSALLCTILPHFLIQS